MNLVRNMQLTEHFRIDEFLVSAEYPELAEKLEPSPVHVNVMYLLCATILEPARSIYNVEFQILSGMRSVELNHAIKGAKHSLHLFAKAADFTMILPEHLEMVYNWIGEKLPFAFSELIWYPKKHFIHVALPHPNVIQQMKVKE